MYTPHVVYVREKRGIANTGIKALPPPHTHVHTLQDYSFIPVKETTSATKKDGVG